MIKTVILGNGSDIQKHIKILKNHNKYVIKGIHCKDKTFAETISKNTSIPLIFDSNNLQDSELLVISDSIDDYYRIAIEHLKKSKCVYIENIGLQNTETINKLVKIADEAKAIIQFGKKSQLSPVFIKAKKQIANPRYIEIKHFEQEPSLSVNKIIFNHLIYDIELILNSIDSQLKTIYASGITIYSNDIDLINARLVFNNGTVATILFQSNSKNKLHELIFYQTGKKISIDFNKQSLCIEKKINDTIIQHKKTLSRKSKLMYNQYTLLDEIITCKIEPLRYDNYSYNALITANQIYNSI